MPRILTRARAITTLIWRNHEMEGRSVSRSPTMLLPGSAPSPISAAIFLHSAAASGLSDDPLQRTWDWERKIKATCASPLESFSTSNYTDERLKPDRHSERKRGTSLRFLPASTSVARCRQKGPMRQAWARCTFCSTAAFASTAWLGKQIHCNV
jgi:hypothetical protein